MKKKTSTRYGSLLRPKMEKGGPILNQWDLPSDPNTPGYEDYGDMYTVPQWPGLMYKDPGMSKGWEGFGNPANLQQTSWDNTQQSGALSAQPKQQLAMDASDYSIDNIRSQYMKNGGFSQRKGYFWNGKTMQKAVSGAYDGTVQYQSGGAIIPKGFQQIPMHQDMGRYGLNLYKNGGMAKVPIQQHMGRYGLLLYKNGGGKNSLPYSVPSQYKGTMNRPEDNSRQFYIENVRYPSLFQRYSNNWTKEDEQASDDRAAFIRELEGITPIEIKPYPIDKKTLRPIPYEQYTDYSYMNKPQFEYIGNDQEMKTGGSVPPTYTAYVNPSTKGMQYGGSMYAEGGIHIKPENKGKFMNPYNHRPYYRNGGIVEGDYDINDMSPAEISHLKSLGYEIEYL